MPATEDRKPKRKKRTEGLPAHKALSHPVSHPIRVRILEAVNEEDMSPTDFIVAGLVPVGIARGRTFKSQVSLIAYHFRGLLTAGCVEVVSTRPVRGALEHTYRGKAVAYFTDQQWAELPMERRVSISRTMYQGLVARVESSMLAGTFEKRSDRMISWIPLELDEQGWTEFHGAMTTCFGDVTDIKVRAAKRLKKSGVKPIPATACLLGFESPPPPKMIVRESR